MSVALNRAPKSKVPCNQILHGDNLSLLQKLPDQSIQLIYIDPPFNTGKKQSRRRIKTVADEQGDRIGFGGRRYKSVVAEQQPSYDDRFSDYMAFLKPRLTEAHRVLTANGSLFFHIDWRESANCRLLLETIFGGGRHCMNEIIWAYDYGARSKSKWSAKHDNIYWFAKDPDNYIFNYDAMEYIPYMAPGLVGKEKALRGKTPTDVWWHTVVPTNGRENMRYPTQKPENLLRWIIAVHSNPNDTVLDFFAGSGTTGAAARDLGRKYLLIDKNPQSAEIMKGRMRSDKSQAIQIMKGKAAAEKESIVIRQEILSVVDTLKQQHRNARTPWLGSPFAWMQSLSSATKSKVARVLIAECLKKFFNLPVEQKRWDLICGEKKLSPKFSMLWESGEYHFQQIRQRDFDYYCFLGLSPHKIHLWVLPQAAYKRLESQHSAEARWISVNPQRQDGGAIKFSDYGGDLETLPPNAFNFVK